MCIYMCVYVCVYVYMCIGVGRYQFYTWRLLSNSNITVNVSITVILNMFILVFVRY